MMAGFVERQIDQMKERFPCVVGFERRENECPAPPKQYQKHDDTTGEPQRVRRRI